MASLLEFGKAIEKTVEWAKCWNNGGNVNVCVMQQIQEYIKKAGE